MNVRTLMLIALALAGCSKPSPEVGHAPPWQPRKLDWDARSEWVRDTATVEITGHVRLPLEMTTAEDRSTLELWPRRNQRFGTDLLLDIAVGPDTNMQRPLPESYADSSLFILGADGAPIRHQGRVRVLGRWAPGSKEILQVLRITTATDAPPPADSLYALPLTKAAMRSGEAEGQLVHAEGQLRQPSIMLPDRDQDLVLAAKGFNVTSRIWVGNGPSQLKVSGGLLGNAEPLDMHGQPLASKAVRVYGVFHDNRIYVEEMQAAQPDGAGSSPKGKPSKQDQ